MQVRPSFFVVLLLSLLAFSQSPNSSNQSGKQSVQEQQFQLRRQNFDTGRQLLLDKGVPFDPDELLREQWSKDLKAKLDALPEMHQTRYEKAPLKGAYLADTLYLPEKVQLSGHTVILANYVVFEGKNPVIKGNFDLHFFPTKPVTVLDTTLAELLARKPGLQNVKFAAKVSLPSFLLIQNLVKNIPHNITLDTSAPEPQALHPVNPHPPAPKQRASTAKLLPAALVAQNCSKSCDLSGASGSSGANGSPGLAGTPGENPGKSPDGSCSASFNGQGGFPGGDGTDGSNGGPGGPGGNGGDGGAINAQVIDGDVNVYDFITNGGRGGVGGNGGDGGMAGDGGRGGTGGNGVACGCQLGEGGDAGHGGNGGVGGNGGTAGAGGNGGNGGTISVSLPWNSPGANTINNAGGGGQGGIGGQGGLGGNAGSAGAPGSGASGCGNTAPNGSPNFGGSAGKPGNGGASGGGGAGGTHGPSATISFRPNPNGGGGGGGGDPCLGGGGGGFQPGSGPTPDPECSPIIIDTEKEGFHLTSASAGVSFDISGTGHPVQIAWTDSRFHNAFLALPGSDGLVHTGKELFGNFTPQPKSLYPNGFIALAQFDKPENGGNGDGIIDERDAVFSQLRLWIDENHDGICQPNELHRLPELGVYSLSLSVWQSSRADEFGNVFRYRGRVNPGDRRDPRDQTPTGEPGRWEYDVFLTVK